MLSGTLGQEIERVLMTFGNVIVEILNDSDFANYSRVLKVTKVNDKVKFCTLSQRVVISITEGEANESK